MIKNIAYLCVSEKNPPTKSGWTKTPLDTQIFLINKLNEVIDKINELDKILEELKHEKN